MSRLWIVLTLIAACSSPPAAPAAPPAEPRPMRSLGGQLAHERDRRGATALPSARVLASLRDAGVVVGEPKQYLALTAGASYCEGGSTAAGVGLAVCEYPDAAAAARGKQQVETRYAALAGQRTIVVRGATTLTVTAAAGALNTVDGRKAVETFTRL